MALPVFSTGRLLTKPKILPNLPQIWSYNTAKIFGTSFISTQGKINHIHFASDAGPRSPFKIFHYTVHIKTLRINARFLTTRHTYLNQKEKNSSDLDVAHIQKELEVANKLSRKQKRAAADPKNSMINVGRFVTDKILELIDENGTSLGSVNRSQAIALSQEKKLKLVLLKPNAKPWPIYKLMTGQELHEEQVKRNEKAKKKTTPTQLKEIKASWNIGQHDIGVRQRQLENWFSDESANIHARVTVTGGKGTETVPQEKQMTVVNQLLHGLEDRLTLNGPPQMVGKNMNNLRVTIRTMSAKEKAAYKKGLSEKVPQRPK
ncbi:translation initiation factor IF-3, mitochondrial-like [Lytechinus pictus]|uniref:translation initiation factor IF-3, mitochondrial-like n=1 Tax=Lytechinus pictus TaxID=7653 RepID=UPI0030BA22BA